MLDQHEYRFDGGSSPRCGHRRASGAATTLVGLLGCFVATAGHAGSGRYDPSTGTWSIIVSLSWEPTAEEIGDIEERFTQASELLYDVTDGEMRFGNVTIFDGGAGKEFADVDITLGSGGASAPSGPGVFGVSFHLFTDDDIYPTGAEDDAWQTIVHEFGHYALNVKDEYSGSGGAAECVVPTPASACIMDNYKITAYADASELCWAGNHDPDADTWQEITHGQSCWDRLDDLYPTISAPSSGPDESAPSGFIEPVFTHYDDALVRVVLVLDTSGSMNGEGGVSPGVSRIEDLETFASQYIDLMGLDDVELGIVTYASTATEVQPVMLLDDAGDVTTSKGNLPSSASGQTSIGGGMVAGRELLTASAAPGPLVMILMTDGYHNYPPGDASLEPLAIVPSLIAEDIRVHTIGLGDSTNEDLLRQIADETGAMFWKANSSLELEPVLSSLGAVVQGGSLLDSSQQHQLRPGESHVSEASDGQHDGDIDALVDAITDDTALSTAVSPRKVEQVLRRIWVEEDNQEVTFNLGWSAEDAVLNLVLETPSGDVITATAVSSGGVDGVRLATGRRYVSYIVDRAESGWWGIAVVAQANPSGTTYAFQATALNVAVAGYADAQVILDNGDTAIRVVGMARDRIAVTEATVNAIMTDPIGATHFIAMTDDGDPSRGDEIAADGLYSGLIGNLAATGNGVYRFDVTFDVDPATATVVPGEEPPPTVDNRTLYEVRHFRRSFPANAWLGEFPDGNAGDQDGDGILDAQDGRGDADGDGKPNDRDADADGDDLSDREEGEVDLDCDGLPNFVDVDSDGDGAEDGVDPTPFEDGGCSDNDRCRHFVCWWSALLGIIIGVLAGPLTCLRKRSV